MCSWPCMVSTVPAKPATAPPRSFVQVLHDSCDVQISQLPSPSIKGDSLSIKITQEEYERGLTDCKRNHHGRLLLNKGDKPMTARDLSTKLSKIWLTSSQWKMISLGRGYYEFQFASYEDIRMAWSMGIL
ncbi:NBS resistance protein, partial [Trifolium medium]|nr:NBS resistance protein [Trifolium medium]